MKRKICFLMAVMMVVGIVGCSEKKPAEPEKDNVSSSEELDVQEGTPVYEDDIQIEIGSYAGPRVLKYRYYNGAYGEHPGDPEGGWEGWLTEEAFRDYLDCGFTYVMPEYDGLYDTKTDGAKREAAYEFEESDLYAYMELAEKVGLPVVVGAEQLTAMTSMTDYRMAEDTKVFFKDMIERLSEYKMFKGVTFRDEPNIEWANSYGAAYDYFKELDSDLYYFTSYLPMYSGDQTRLSKDNTLDLEDAYREYVRTFADATDGFYYDAYPLIIDPATGKTRLEKTWYQNLRIVAEEVKAKGVDAGLTIQAGSFGPENAENSVEHRRTVNTKADVTFQLYTSLAYGMKDIAYFTYWEHWMEGNAEAHYSAMVMYPEKAGGEPIKTDAYYAVKAANEEIKKFDHVFLRYDWEGTMALTKEGVEMSDALKYAGDYQSPRIASVTATDEAIIGCMKDEDGYDGYMIVNATDPGQNLSNTVTVTFKQASKAMIYVEGEEKIVDLEDGSYTFELKSGEGVFAIPLV